MVTDDLEFVLEFQLQRLHHLLHLQYLCFVVQDRLDLLSTRSLIDQTVGSTAIELRLESSVELVKVALFVKI